MARLVSLNPRHFLQGVATVFRGDQWLLDAQLLERVGETDAGVDLTGGSATAYFPAVDCDSEPLAVPVTLTGPASGLFRVSVDESQTEDEVGLAEMGTSLYVVFDTPASGQFTAETVRQDLVIRDRGFQVF